MVCGALSFMLKTELILTAQLGCAAGGGFGPKKEQVNDSGSAFDYGHSARNMSNVKG